MHYKIATITSLLVLSFAAQAGAALHVVGPDSVLDTATPESTTYILLGLGLACVVAVRRKMNVSLFSVIQRDQK